MELQREQLGNQIFQEMHSRYSFFAINSQLVYSWQQLFIFASAHPAWFIQNWKWLSRWSASASFFLLLVCGDRKAHRLSGLDRISLKNAENAQKCFELEALCCTTQYTCTYRTKMAVVVSNHQNWEISWTVSFLEEGRSQKGGKLKKSKAAVKAATAKSEAAKKAVAAVKVRPCW